jgi:hypothetical protein
MKEIQTKLMRLAELVPDPANPRTHDDRNLAAIRASLVEHGQVEPILVQAGSNMVIAGNGRMTAMKALGWKVANVAVLDVDDSQARKLSIALNRSGELAGWDEEVLANHLRDLASLADVFDPTSLGFDSDEMEALVAAYSESVEQMGVDPLEDPHGGPVGPGGGPLPPGTSPSPMPSSQARVVQLFLDDATHPEFQLAVRTMARHYGTDNITDTVFRVVTQAAQHHEPAEA